MQTQSLWKITAMAAALCIGTVASGEPLPEIDKAHPRDPLPENWVELTRLDAVLEYPHTDPSPLQIDWTLGPHMVLPVKGGHIGVLNEHLVVVPGIGFRAHDEVVQALDLGTMQWTGLPPIPKPPVYTTAVTARDSIITLSGRGRQVGPAVQRLRFAEGRWQWDELAALPRKIWYGRSAVVDDRYVITAGGDTGQGHQPQHFSRDVWMLDLDHPTGQWQTVARIQQDAFDPMLAGLNGQVYFLGGAVFHPHLRAQSQAARANGFGGRSNGYLRKKYVHALDLKTRQWRQCADMPYERSGGLALPYQDRYIFVFGGAGHRDGKGSKRPGRSSPKNSPSTGFWHGHHDEVFLYHTVKDRWSVLDCPMPYGINDPQATIHGQTVYVTGGEPNHWFNYNTEDVVMIGRIRPAD